MINSTGNLMCWQAKYPPARRSIDHPNSFATIGFILLVFGLSTSVAEVYAEDAAIELAGPNATANILASDAENKPDALDIDEQAGLAEWKAGLKQRTGLDIGIDYNALGYYATHSMAADGAASGVFRVFGTWELFQRGNPDNGSIVFKVENRHAYTALAPKAFGEPLGYVGYPTVPFSDQGWRVTHLFWQQRFGEAHGVAYVGFLDITDYTDVYTLASPWTGFSNLVFQNGSGTIGGSPDGALGAMLGGFISSHFYAAGSVVDANASSSDIGAGFDTLINDFETFKTFEFGWTSRKERLFIDNAHLTFWQIDERKRAGTPDGWGIDFSLSALVDNAWLPFLRGGWSEDGGSTYQASVSAGFGYTRRPGQSQLGVGVNWSRPNARTFATKLDDQITLEVFQQLQLTEGIEITPSIQYIHSPALNPNDDSTLLFGLRLRAAI